MQSGFAGFPPEAVTFFRGLAKNNKREWYQPRKPIFDEKVKASMVELITAMTREMMKFAPDYVTEPDKAIYRIYRDTRFSKDKTPYKTHIAASFSRRGMEKHGAAGYYFSVSHQEIEVGGGIYMPPPEALLSVRHHVADHHAEFRALTANRSVRRLFGEMQGEQLSRVPKGFLPDHPAADLLRFKQYLLFTVLDPALVTTPKLYSELIARFRAMTPFLEFLNAPLVRAQQKKKPLLQYKEW